MTKNLPTTTPQDAKRATRRPFIISKKQLCQLFNCGYSTLNKYYLTEAFCQEHLEMDISKMKKIKTFSIEQTAKILEAFKVEAEEFA